MAATQQQTGDKNEDQFPDKKKGMPDIKEKHRDDPHRGITDTPPQHGDLAPEDEELDEEDFEEEDFDEELELDEDEDEEEDD